jgi:hypothetical protein
LICTNSCTNTTSTQLIAELPPVDGVIVLCCKPDERFSIGVIPGSYGFTVRFYGTSRKCIQPEDDFSSDSNDK